MLRAIITISMIMAFIPMMLNFINTLKMELEKGVMLDNIKESKKTCMLMTMAFSAQMLLTGLSLWFYTENIGMQLVFTAILFTVNLLNAVKSGQTLLFNTIKKLQEEN